MDTLERFSRAGIVPVVVIDHAADALPTARALLDGGVDWQRRESLHSARS